jgi:hypothetical protein
MPSRHEERTNRDRAGATQNAVGNEAAGDRRKINETGVKAEDGRGERLY